MADEHSGGYTYMVWGKSLEGHGRENMQRPKQVIHEMPCPSSRVGSDLLGCPYRGTATFSALRWCQQVAC